MPVQLDSRADWALECRRLLRDWTTHAFCDIGWPEPPAAQRQAHCNPGITLNWPVVDGWRIWPAGGSRPRRGRLDTLCWSAAGHWLIREHGPRAHFRKLVWRSHGVECTDNRLGRRRVLAVAAPSAHRQADLYAALADRGECSTSHRSAAFALALHDLVQDLERPASSRAAAGQRDWLALCDHLEEHLDQAIGRDDCAALIGVHPGHVSRLFRRHAGCSFAAWLRRRRIERAERLLRQSDLPLDAIARACGLGDATWLIRCFKAQHGCTPGSWRSDRASRH